MKRRDINRALIRIADDSFGHELRMRAVPEWAKAYCSCGWHGPCRSWWRARVDRDMWRHAVQAIRNAS